MTTEYEQALDKALNRVVELEQYLGADKLTLIENNRRLGSGNRRLKKENRRLKKENERLKEENERLVESLERRDKTEKQPTERYDSLLKKYQNLMVANHALTRELCEVKEKCLGITE